MTGCSLSDSGRHDWWFDPAISAVRCTACHTKADLEEQDWADPWLAIERLQPQGRRQ